MGSFSLVVLYVLIKYLNAVWLIEIVFLFVFMLILSQLYIDLIGEFFTKGNESHFLNSEIFYGISWQTFIGTLSSFIICVLWFISWNWILSNFMGTCFVFMILRLVWINNLIASSILLILLFLYDIFWVFISPQIPGFGGSSVMIVVATGLEIPVKLVCPASDLL